MNETTVTLVGNAATEVRYRQSASGIPVASFRMASTTRRWDRERGAWSDGHTSFYTVWAWRHLAGNVAASVGRGDPLVVQGRMRVREWESGGQRHTSVEIDAGVVGHDLSRGTSAFRRAVRAAAGAVHPQPLPPHQFPDPQFPDAGFADSQPPAQRFPARHVAVQSFPPGPAPALPARVEPGPVRPAPRAEGEVAGVTPGVPEAVPPPGSPAGSPAPPEPERVG